MEQLERNGVRLEPTTGDMTKQPAFDAIVNAANAQLRIEGGVTGMTGAETRARAREEPSPPLEQPENPMKTQPPPKALARQGFPAAAEFPRLK